jgi:type IV secretory pathway TraG/TraD family ATPase VirD4
MNRLFEFIERLLWGTPEAGDGAGDELDTPLMTFSTGTAFTVRDAFENVLFIGSPGSGKTSAAGTYYRALLRAQFGGLILCVKETQVKDLLKVCRECGREKDVIEFSVNGGHRFNPLAGASVTEAASLLVELADALRRQTGGKKDDAFFRQQSEIMMDRLLALCWSHYGRLDISDLSRMFKGRPTDLTRLVDPVWRLNNVMAEALAQAKDNPDEDVQRAVEYFEVDFPTHGDRMQGSLAATVSGVLDSLSSKKMLGLFSGQSTFTMRDLWESGKICLMAMPVLGSKKLLTDSKEGAIANAVMQFCFCREVVRVESQKNLFLISDECQETISRELRRQLSVLREYRVATVLLTQDLPTIDTVLDENEREAIFAKCKTKVFLQQTHEKTREWAAAQIGKYMGEQTSYNTTQSDGKTSRGQSTQQAELWRVRPEEFAKLKTGGKENEQIVESVVVYRGRWGRERWHQEKPGEKRTVKIA